MNRRTVVLFCSMVVFMARSDPLNGPFGTPTREKMPLADQRHDDDLTQGVTWFCLGIDCHPPDRFTG
jgi:hypothetical protein